MADLATVFHWPPSEMDGMDLEELADWWHRARVRADPKENDG